MSWDTFRQQVKMTMELMPKDSDDLAKVLASAYDMAVKTPPAGDLAVGNAVMNGNVAALENVIKNVFNLQAVSPKQLNLFELFTAGLQAYWAGSTLQVVRPCLFPLAPGASANLSTLTVVCSNPGQTVPFPTELIKPESTVGPFIENFIQAAEMHFKTISGEYNVNSMYGFLPTATSGPGIVPWVGYTIDASKVIAANEIEVANILNELGGFKTIDELVNAYQSGATGDADGGGSIDKVNYGDGTSKGAVEANIDRIRQIAEICVKYGWTGRARIASLLAISGGENLWSMREEGFHYTKVERLAEVFSIFRQGWDTTTKPGKKIAIPKPEAYNFIPGGTPGPKGLANYIYAPQRNGKLVGNTQPDDGGKFIGRGLIQLTGREAYEHYGKLAGVDILNNPKLLVNSLDVSVKVATEFYKERVERQNKVSANAQPQAYYIAARDRTGFNVANIKAVKDGYFNYFIENWDKLGLNDGVNPVAKVSTPLSTPTKTIVG